MRCYESTIFRRGFVASTRGVMQKAATWLCWSPTWQKSFRMPKQLVAQFGGDYSPSKIAGGKIEDRRRHACRYNESLIHCIEAAYDRGIKRGTAVSDSSETNSRAGRLELIAADTVAATSILADHETFDRLAGDKSIHNLRDVRNRDAPVKKVIGFD